MNIDSLDRKCKVVSKYFTGNTVMDESLSDFQEKKSFKGPKNVKVAAKPKAKRAAKQIKGQKDIRTALKPRKNELLAYSKDFDAVCKKSGIDVDSEQLQLAIALSKSLETTEPADGSTTSKPLSSQQRAGAIRKTLQEYGFKVPVSKPSTSRKKGKRKKPYKLLLTTIEQKQQLISDRYSQLLFEVNNSKPINSYTGLDVSNLFVYNMATNIEYKDIKDDDIFYVENLIEKSANSMGCLLKNWSDIPGRPASPTQEKSDIIFSEIECSQDEVDIVLSGSLKFSKDILRKKGLNHRKSIDCCIIEEVTAKTQETDPVDIKDCNVKSLSPDVTVVSNDSEKTAANKYPVQLLMVTQPTKQPRSLSPDLFDDDDDDDDDDEDEEVVEIHNEIAIESPVKHSSYITKETSEVMDLTECVNIISQRSMNINRHTKPLSQLSQEIDATKRKSNDFMEMTECVIASSQPVLNRIDEHIDLTAHCYVDVDIITNKSVTSIDNIEHMDLTQSSNTSTETLPFVFISGKEPVPDKSLNDTIILNDNDYLEVQSPNTNAEANEANTVHGYLDPKNSDTYSKNKANLNIQVKSVVETKEMSVISLDESCEIGTTEENVDLTQTSYSNEADTNFAPNNHSIPQINYSSLGKKDDVSVDYDEALENMNSISYCANDASMHDDNNYEITQDNFREPNTEVFHTNSEHETSEALQLSDTEAHSPNEEGILTDNKHSEVLELSDTEVNSTNKDKEVENHFDFGGFSVLNNMPSFSRMSSNTIGSVNNGTIMSESLPMVDVRGKQSPVKLKTPFKEFIDTISDQINDKNVYNDKLINVSQTPLRGDNNYVNVETPKQTEYIVKTDNVTPMMDYASMSSPERNRELDKYGLKPFKRKRAIQLLTHLYNQTHPYVESTEELPSPSKRQKQDNLSQPSTSRSLQKTVKSPRKKSKSPRDESISPRTGSENFGSLNVSDKENDIFMVTNEVPAIRNMECDVEDWVFQKREKAKLHSCRVPLHIAFHNYVSCRSRLHEAILRYEPVSIDVIHKGLAATGHRYDPKDLLKFMDKKCITVKTADNAKNKNRY